MSYFLLSSRRCLFSALCAVFVAGCTVPVSPDVAVDVDPSPPACTPVSDAQDAVLGNWLAVRSQKGVAGELRTLFTLQPDGSMAYTEQLKRPGQPSQGLSETGCWYRDGQDLVLQTQESHGLPVDLADPIYTNRYQVISVDDAMLRLVTPEGVQIHAKPMSPGYRLPF